MKFFFGLKREKRQKKMKDETEVIPSFEGSESPKIDIFLPQGQKSPSFEKFNFTHG